MENKNERDQVQTTPRATTITSTNHQFHKEKIQDTSSKGICPIVYKFLQIY